MEHQLPMGISFSASQRRCAIFSLQFFDLDEQLFSEETMILQAANLISAFPDTSAAFKKTGSGGKNKKRRHQKGHLAKPQRAKGILLTLCIQTVSSGCLDSQVPVFCRVS